MSLVAILHHFTIIEPNVFWITLISGHSLPFAFLTGPFLYFYTRNASRGKVVFLKNDFLHYIPFVLVLASVFPYYFTAFDSKLKLAQLLVQNPNSMITQINFSWLYPSYWNILARPLFLVAYSVYSLVFIQRNLTLKKQKFSLKNSEPQLKWLVIITSLFVLISTLYSLLTINFFLRYIQNREEINQSPLSYLIYALLCVLPVLMLVFPEILYDVKKNKKPSKPEPIVEADNHDEFVKTTQLILDFLKKEENLANPKLGVTTLCNDLGLSKEDVDYCFTVVLKTKIAAIKKQLRVELAKEELKKGMLVDHSMEGIWMKAGFTSKTSFFVCFKEETGMTPLNYVKYVVEETKPE
jgi:AraC-like DNA-binding protein